MWLGLDRVLSPAVTHDMGAAFMLYAQGLLPFLLPLSVLLFEPDAGSRRRMLPFVVIGGATTLYILWALAAYSLQVFLRGNSIVYINPATNQHSRSDSLCNRNVRFAFFLQGEGHDRLRRGEHGNSVGRDGGQAVCVYFAVVYVRGRRECDHPCLFLEEQRRPAFLLCAEDDRGPLNSMSPLVRECRYIELEAAGTRMPTAPHVALSKQRRSKCQAPQWPKHRTQSASTS